MPSYQFVIIEAFIDALIMLIEQEIGFLNVYFNGLKHPY